MEVLIGVGVSRHLSVSAEQEPNGDNQIAAFVQHCLNIRLIIGSRLGLEEVRVCRCEAGFDRICDTLPSRLVEGLIIDTACVGYLTSSNGLHRWRRLGSRSRLRSLGSRRRLRSLGSRRVRSDWDRGCGAIVVVVAAKSEEENEG